MKICKSLVLVLFVFSALLVLSGAAVANDVSGTVSYEGSQTGRIYVTLSNNGFGGGNVYGVSIPWPGSGVFTVRGLQDGNYTLNAFLDSVGSRGRHTGNPQGSAPVIVSGGNVTGVAVTLTDPVLVTAAPPDGLNVMPGDSGAFVMWDAERDQNGVYKADTFNLYWSTDASFLSSWPTITAEGSTIGIPASDSNNVFIHTGLSNGQTYYYLMTGSTGTLVSSQTVTAAATPAAPAGGSTVSGTVTASGFDPAGSNLHVVLFSDSNGVFFTTINDPAADQAFSVPGVSDGTFFVYPVYDLNTNGLMDQSDVKPNDDKNITMVEVSGGPVSGVASTVALVDSVTYAATSHWKQSNGCQEGYNLNTSSRDGGKLIANLTIYSSPTNSVGFVGALDVGLNNWGEFSFGAASTRPAIGDNFDFHIEYTDGSTDVVNKAVTAVIDDFATPVAPLGVIANTPAPTFTWSLETTPSYEYVYQLSVNSQYSSWYPDEDIPSSQLSAGYNFDGRAYPSSLPGNAAYSWSIGLRDNDGNESRTQVNFAMGGGIAGTVTNGSTGIGCVMVTATTSTQNNYLSSVWTNSDGTYAVGGFGTGDYKVSFDAGGAGYSSEWYNNKTDWSNADTVSVPANEVHSGIDAVLAQAGRIAGRVTNGATGIANVWVEAHDATSGNFVSGSDTDANGDYTINGLTTGSYKVWFNTWNVTAYSDEWYDNKPDQGSADVVAVTDGSTTTLVDAVLAVGASISGQVTNGTTGIQNVNVWACTVYAGGWCDFPYYSANTDASGTYTISGVPPAQYKVFFNAQSAGYVSDWYNAAAVLNVTAGVAMTGINGVLVQGGGISGRVTSNGTTGIQNVSVSVCKYNGPMRYNCDFYFGFGGTNTDMTGNYTLSGLPAGQYEVQFDGYSSGYGFEWYNDTTDQNASQLVSITTGATTTGIDAVLGQAGGISGRVTSNGTTGIASAPVSVVNASTGVYVQSTMTDPAGYYTVNIAAGQYKVSFDATGFTTEWYNDKTSFESADTVTVTGGIMTNSIDAVLSLAGPQPSPNILWRNTATGDVYLWTMNGTAQTGGVTIGNIPDPSWQVVGEADFNNDGSPDILWRNSTTGDVYVWTMTGTTHTGGLAIGNIPDPAWQIAATGDFTNDGSPDILWRNSDTGDVYVWIMTGTTHTSGVTIGNISDPAWQIVGAADYNIDTNPDILWRNSTTGDVYVWTMTGTMQTGGVTIGNISDPAWQIVATGDFNGDVNNDILWRNTTTGDVYLWTMTGTTNTSGVTIGNIPDPAWHIVGPK